jgi:signal transduction histidine kinase
MEGTAGSWTAVFHASICAADYWATSVLASISRISNGLHEEDLSRQKMATVGALAGGIAHDFNNLLGGVLSHAELGLAEIADGSYPSDELNGIRGAAIRGSEIVRQLMVYAGEETEELRLVDVSEIVEDMLALLNVSVSKHVTVETDLSGLILSPEPCTVG